jgi:hypothetical protein
VKQKAIAVNLDEGVLSLIIYHIEVGDKEK